MHISCKKGSLETPVALTLLRMKNNVPCGPLLMLKLNVSQTSGQNIRLNPEVTRFRR